MSWIKREWSFFKAAPWHLKVVFFSGILQTVCWIVVILLACDIKSKPQAQVEVTSKEGRIR